MAYSEDLANRVREQLAGEDAITEKAMFGGLAFLLGGNMSVGVAGDELMVRVGPEATETALAEPHARPFDMTGRPMRGWVLVGAAGVRTDPQLRAWVGRGVTFARSLPPKG
jgi:TfoX/Sxy family transcriptional regulator of competence genes